MEGVRNIAIRLPKNMLVPETLDYQGISVQFSADESGLNRVRAFVHTDRFGFADNDKARVSDLIEEWTGRAPDDLHVCDQPGCIF